MQSHKRAKTTCEPQGECSNEEINELIREMKNVDNDPNMKNYEYPTDEELQTIVNEAKNYTGEWYHSNVLIQLDEQFNEPKTELYKEFDNLIKTGTSGIYAKYSITIPEETEKALLAKMNTEV